MSSWEAMIGAADCKFGDFERRRDDHFLVRARDDFNFFNFETKLCYGRF